MFLRRKPIAESPCSERAHPPAMSAVPPQELYNEVAAIAVNELRRPPLLREYARRPPDDQPIFMMAYSAFLLWSLSLGFNGHWKADDIRKALKAARDAFAIRPWFDPSIFANIWKQTQIVMPKESRPGKYGGLVYPAADIFLTATLAGYALDSDHDPEFGYHVTLTMERMAEQAKLLATTSGRDYIVHL